MQINNAKNVGLPGLEPGITRTRIVHVSHYTTARLKKTKIYSKLLAKFNL